MSERTQDRDDVDHRAAGQAVGDDDAMEAEFDTVATWTEQAVAELGRGYAIPAACRGSGSPADLEWLAEGLALSGDDRFLDAGAGLGGPAAWLCEHLGDRWRGRPLLVDPMPHAVASSRRLFGLPAVAATGEDLPLPDDAVEAAWSLGVLCTTTDKDRQLAELGRVLRPGGRLALLVLVADTDPLPESPEGNHFPTRDALREVLAGAGFAVTAQVDAADLPDASPDWCRRADRVTDVVTRDHRDHPSWRQADEQHTVLSRLMDRGHVVATLLRAVLR